MDRGWGGGQLDTGRAAAAGGAGEELTVNLNVAEATGARRGACAPAAQRSEARRWEERR